MTRTTKWAAAAVLGLAGAACSAVLGLEPPPAPDAGVGEIDAGNPVCAALDAGDAGVTWFPMALDAGAGWDFFDTSSTGAPAPPAFSGGTFDGQYVYLAGSGGVALQYDTTAAGGFGAPGSWHYFNLAPTGALGFSGAVFDGRYVYFVPTAPPFVSSSTPPQSRIARFDTKGAGFTSAAAWSTLDLETLPGAGAGAALAGFVGAGFDGRYLYLVPHADGAPDGRVVRYDTEEPDAGKPVDAGVKDGGDAGEASDAGDAGDLADPIRWDTFDVSGANPLATGFSGAAFDGKAMYLAPTFNDAGINRGYSAIVARFDEGEFDASASWSTFDLTTVNGDAYQFVGAGFDGRYVYLAPRGSGIVVRYDTKSNKLTSAASWSTYDVTRVVPRLSLAVPSAQYQGVAFDGRFVYLVPGAGNFGTVARYDTLSTFTADCAWSTADLTQLETDGGVPQDFNGAVFDGQYLYLIPFNNGVVARFKVKDSPSQPALPAFHGSFW